ncbi:aldose 1-epimerase family protein [Geodermatophilus marinus]|uniref:aldose 1-epimerase family protein n=1 Tax=Geodermatophilus sp. LHW52908 TaxID=2303986 RepID=UPI000E3C1ECA|nr:aldose 1-epimerase family protein [Geodermatophilus sp. LHW52908]RFU21065.1 aldose epimerase [Geodermatophilus sp. LHW52908]
MSDPTAPWPATEPTEVVVSAGDTRLVVDLRGGTLRALIAGDREVLDGYPAGALPSGRRGGVLLPWPNRVRDGRWTWRGEEHRLEVSSAEKPVAIHGLVSWQPWSVLAQADGAVTVGTVVEPRPGYPFRLAAAFDHRLEAGRLTVTARVRNAGDAAAPFGLGLHPYLGVGATEDGGIADAELSLPARTELVVDAAGLPTGERRPFDGAVGRLGERSFDTPLTDLERDGDGWARVRLRGPAGWTELAVDPAWGWLQVYTGDTLSPGERRRSVAVEPMTCPPNALADGADLVVLEPGADWSGTWSLAWGD